MGQVQSQTLDKKQTVSLPSQPTQQKQFYQKNAQSLRNETQNSLAQQSRCVGSPQTQQQARYPNPPQDLRNSPSVEPFDTMTHGYPPNLSTMGYPYDDPTARFYETGRFADGTFNVRQLNPSHGISDQYDMKRLNMPNYTKHNKVIPLTGQDLSTTYLTPRERGAHPQQSFVEQPIKGTHPQQSFVEQPIKGTHPQQSFVGQPMKGTPKKYKTKEGFTYHMDTVSFTPSGCMITAEGQYICRFPSPVTRVQNVYPASIP